MAVIERSFELKFEKLKRQFSNQNSKENIYQKIMEYGKELDPFPEEEKTEFNKVSGCQSEMYLFCEAKEGKIYYKAYSDALISAGLAGILIFLYSGEKPETILKSSSQFLENLGIPTSLTPTRANGLAHLYIKMKQHALLHSFNP